MTHTPPDAPNSMEIGELVEQLCSLRINDDVTVSKVIAGRDELTFGHLRALLRTQTEAETKAAEDAKRIGELRGLVLEARLARLNWQKYNAEQGDEIVYQAEKMASAIDQIDAALNGANGNG